MRDASPFVSLDVHKNTISVAMLRPCQPFLEWSLANETVAVCRFALPRRPSLASNPKQTTTPANEGGRR